MDIAKAMQQNFAQVRSHLEEHLSAINENTAEIQALFDYLREFEVRIEKLSQRLDSMQMSHTKHAHKCVLPLDHNEKQVFLALYTDEMPLSYQEIASRCDVPTPLVLEAVSSMMNKGIPILRSTINDRAFVQVERDFKELQAKENIVNLSLANFMK